MLQNRRELSKFRQYEIELKSINIMNASSNKKHATPVLFIDAQHFNFARSQR